MTENKTLELFHASLDRATANPEFLDTFYDRFFSSSDDVAQLFSNTDMERLKRKLKASLRMITKQVDHEPGADMYMEHLARLHQGYAIPPAMYKQWLNALIRTASDCDPEFNEVTGQAWRDAIQPAIEIMAHPVDRSKSMEAL